MNGTYYQNPTFPSAENPNMEMNNYTANIVPVDKDGILNIEQSYIENILRMNKDKKVKAYVSFADSVSWRDRVFDGHIEQAGRDHLIMSLLDGKWVLIPMIYLDYVEFEDEINYVI